MTERMPRAYWRTTGERRRKSLHMAFLATRHESRRPGGVRVEGVVYATLKTAFLLVLPSDE